MSELIPAFRKDISLQREIHEARKKGGKNSFDVWWLGQSGFLIQWNGTCSLFDPYLSDSLTKKYASTNKPHVRMSERVIDPALLDCIDIVTSSHNHTDHLDGETLIPLLKSNPDIALLIPEANRDFVAERVGCNREFPVGISDGETAEIKGVTFHGVPAAHNTLERDAKGNCKFMGYVMQFGNFALYHSGDTLWYEGMEKILKPFGVDVAFLPINGNDPSRGVAGNLNALEAARLGKEIGARFVIPHHYDMFKFNTADPVNFIAEADKSGQPYVVLKPGERWTCRKTDRG
ncbi:MAG TPA: MBL fold metallo-hydrolase [Chryseosolibacter sp.]|nr:MBL fold metallo-hydrolase [Chryseosolibacter sp.]